MCVNGWPGDAVRLVGRNPAEMAQVLAAGLPRLGALNGRGVHRDCGPGPHCSADTCGVPLGAGEWRSMLILGLNGGSMLPWSLCQDGRLSVRRKKNSWSREKDRSDFRHAVSAYLKTYGLDVRRLDHICLSNLRNDDGGSRDGMLAYYVRTARSFTGLFPGGRPVRGK